MCIICFSFSYFLAFFRSTSLHTSLCTNRKKNNSKRQLLLHFMFLLTALSLKKKKKLLSCMFIHKEIAIDVLHINTVVALPSISMILGRQTDGGPHFCFSPCFSRSALIILGALYYPTSHSVHGMSNFPRIRLLTVAYAVQLHML